MCDVYTKKVIKLKQKYVYRKWKEDEKDSMSIWPNLCLIDKCDKMPPLKMSWGFILEFWGIIFCFSIFGKYFCTEK